MSAQALEAHRTISLLRRLERLPEPVAIVLSLIVVFGVSLADRATGPDLSPLFGYLVAVAFAAWSTRRPIPDAIALASVATSVLVTTAEADVSSAAVIGTAILRFGVLEVTVYLSALLRATLGALDQEASTDPLTGLLNRRALEVVTGAEFSRSDRTGTPLSVFAFDLDGLKTVNDREGHAAGDALILRAAEALRSGVRATDHVARVGGDEFIVVLPDTSAVQADELLGRLLRDPTVPPLTGGAATRAAEDDIDSLLDRADRSQVAAKADKRRTAETN